MAERKDGPVKPPIIDAKARNAAKPDQSKTAPSSRHKTPDKVAQKPDLENTRSKPQADKRPADATYVSATPLLSALLIGVSSATLGAILAFGVAYFGFWPTTENDTIPPAKAADVAVLALSVSQHQSDLDALATSFAQKYDQEKIETTTRFEALDVIIQDIGARPVPEAIDLSPLQTAVAALKAEMALIDISSSSGENGASLAVVTKLQSGLNQMADQIRDIETAYLQDKVALDEALNNLDKSTQSSNEVTSTQQSTAQIALALSGLNAALFSGRPYVDALNFLMVTQPVLAVPADIAANATSGLPLPSAITQKFDDLAPIMISKRPILQDGTWQEVALDRLKAMISLRPLTPVEGDSPDAVMSRLEEAILNQEFADALKLLTSLPQSMRAVSIDLEEELAILAGAYSFLLDARAQASKIRSPALLESTAQ